MPHAITVINRSNVLVETFVSKYNGGGSDEWFKLAGGERDTWNRDNEGWELVAFKTSDNKRDGRYVKIGSVIVFNSIGDIQVV